MGQEIEIAGYKWDSHTELIECPECDCDQIATVIHTLPFYLYHHKCTVCGYDIGESEWNTCGRVVDSNGLVTQTMYSFDFTVVDNTLRINDIISITVHEENLRLRVVEVDPPHAIIGGTQHVTAIPYKKTK